MLIQHDINLYFAFLLSLPRSFSTTVPLSFLPILKKHQKNNQEQKETLDIRQCVTKQKKMTST